MNKLILFIALLLPFAGLQTQAHAAKTIKATKAETEPLVLMPVRVSEEDKGHQTAMETALVEGLQHAALKDAQLFQQVSIELGALTWPNGADLDRS